ncbi:MAG: alpha/beta fold hydrolase [Candidatus Komeilibacteria bacterium]|nr:alpha/beta fold hydrolase [Candidatus Komeilibacteria bacterium]
MNTAKLFYLITVLPLVLSGCLTANAPLGQNKNIIPTSATLAESVQAKISHAVSLPALFDKEIIGSNLKLGQVLARTSLYTRYYITYQSNQLTISGIMNVPVGAGLFPVLILNHGHIDTAIYTNGRGLKREQDYLANQGYVVLHTDYRNHAQSDKDNRDELAVRLSYAEDSLAAAEAVKNSQLAFIDPNNIGTLGHSMGGGVTLTSLVAKPGLIKAAVLYAPVSGNYALSYERWLAKRPETVVKLDQLYGSPTNNPDFWYDLSAENFYDRIIAPVAIFHGTADDSVPLEWSKHTLDALTKADVPAQLTIYQNGPHEFGVHWTDFMQKTTAFFDQHLKN